MSRPWRVAGVVLIAVITTLSIVVALAQTRGRVGVGSEQKEKAALAARLEEANRKQIANAPRGRKGDPAAGRPAAGPPAAWDQGVYETQEAPIPVGVFHEVTTAWGQTIGENNYSVYAGDSMDDHEQGLLLVMKFSRTGGFLEHESFPTPARLGAVRIVSATGHRLTLRGETGAAFVFDFDARRFV